MLRIQYLRTPNFYEKISKPEPYIDDAEIEYEGDIQNCAIVPDGRNVDVVSVDKVKTSDLDNEILPGFWKPQKLY